MARTAGSSSTMRIVPFPVTARRLAMDGGRYNRDVAASAGLRRGASGGPGVDTSSHEPPETLNSRAAFSARDRRTVPGGSEKMMCLALMTGIAAFVGVRMALRHGGWRHRAWAGRCGG